MPLLLCVSHEHPNIFKVITMALVNVATSRDIVPCSLYMNRRFGVTYHLNFRAENSGIQGRVVRIWTDVSE
jgi:hypothetical protein